MTPAFAAKRLDALAAELTRGGTATQVLEAWAGGPILAERVLAEVPATSQTRALLRADALTPLGFRRVRLMCGDVLLSQADNWFVLGRLTAEMRAALDDSDTPFGRVIAPLSPYRETLVCERLAGDPALLVRALVLNEDGEPLALVEERYRRTIIAPPPSVTPA